MTLVSQEFDHVIGVDTHAKTHTLVVLDCHGARQTRYVLNEPGGVETRSGVDFTLCAGTQPCVLVAMEGTDP
ncbi:hypothetical protein RCH23_002802 [Cryobacterium sp. CAN_C3]|uniref:hypothetical protein n=1 Tax=unclassified Cryobacterium TaxID=2649013 RepID=UPI0018CB97E7|nr:hypothetical protein [Cryobacterium sp. CAN_C3]MEC5155406.1 hypothetical protein [Cryobacterium sp. CAN_C3]